jgi:uncharacterized integral membrane protein
MDCHIGLTGAAGFPSFGRTMNVKLLLKTVFLIVVALLLVLMGMHNDSRVSLSLPPLLPSAFELPAAIMYVGFFGFGFLSGAILNAGKKGGGK